jgi:hypothetical protein
MNTEEKIKMVRFLERVTSSTPVEERLKTPAWRRMLDKQYQLEEELEKEGIFINYR